MTILAHIFLLLIIMSGPVFIAAKWLQYIKNKNKKKYEEECLEC